MDSINETFIQRTDRARSSPYTTTIQVNHKHQDDWLRLRVSRLTTSPPTYTETFKKSSYLHGGAI